MCIIESMQLTLSGKSVVYMFLPTHYFVIGTKYLFMLWPYIVFYDDNSLYYYMFVFTQRNVITGFYQYLSMLFKYNWVLGPILITVSLYRVIKVFTHCIYDHIHIKLNNSKTDLRYFQRIDGLLSIGNRASCLRGGIRGTIFFDGVLVICMITEREFVFSPHLFLQSCSVRV